MHMHHAVIKIGLSDIVVPPWIAGLGLGSAALSHLCRCADDVGATITGVLYPGSAYKNDQETRIPRLARWYARHGFAVGDLPAVQWQIGSSMTRAPGEALPLVPAPQ